jgi:hypothetical protein
MLTLPAFPPRRAWLLAFNLSLTLSLGVVLGLLLGAMLGWLWSAAAFVFAAVFFLLGWMWPRMIEYAYRAWNKLAREFARFARFWLLAVLYYVVFIPVGWAGSLLRITAPDAGESLWTRRESLSVDRRPGTRSTRSWLAAYLSWCGRDRHQWAMWLVPFLLMLSVLQTEEKKGSVPSDIYTLY